MKEKMKLSYLAKNEMKNLTAGYIIRCDAFGCCGCACRYEDSGGSSTGQNENANYLDGLASPL